jgi:hypothetical protein
MITASPPITSATISAELSSNRSMDSMLACRAWVGAALSL